MRANQGESSHYHRQQQQQQQQQQHSDIIDVTDLAKNDKGLSKSGAQTPILYKEVFLCIQFLLLQHAFKYPVCTSLYAMPCSMSRQQQRMTDLHDEVLTSFENHIVASFFKLPSPLTSG